MNADEDPVALLEAAMWEAKVALDKARNVVERAPGPQRTSFVIAYNSLVSNLHDVHASRVLKGKKK